MKYSDYRQNIKTGDLIAFSHNALGSKIIKLFTRSKYTHVAIAYRIADRVMIFESTIPRVRLFPLSKMGDFYHLSVGRDLSPTAEEFAFSRLGEWYSISECIRGFFSKANNNNMKWQCAEFGKQILRANAFRLSRKDTPISAVQEMELQLNRPGVWVTNP